MQYNADPMHPQMACMGSSLKESKITRHGIHITLYICNLTGELRALRLLVPTIGECRRPVNERTVAIVVTLTQ